VVVIVAVVCTSLILVVQLVTALLSFFIEVLKLDEDPNSGSTALQNSLLKIAIVSLISIVIHSIIT